MSKLTREQWDDFFDGEFMCRLHASIAELDNMSRCHISYSGFVEEADQYFDSPIEAAIVWACLNSDSNYYGVDCHFLPNPANFTMQQALAAFDLTCADASCVLFYGPRNKLMLIPQFQLGQYRLDFLAIGRDWYGHPDHNGPVKVFAVECDGHDYHERTKEQAARDRSRDRAIQRAGLPVLRFTGSEIYADPLKCAEEVWRFIGR